MKKTIHIITNDPENEDIALSLSIDIKEPLVINPLSINFGKVTKGNTYRKQITISNMGIETIRITEIKLKPENVLGIRGVKKFTIKPGKRTMLNLLFTPDKITKKFYGTVVITTDADDISSKVIKIQAEVSPPPVK